MKDNSITCVFCIIRIAISHNFEHWIKMHWMTFNPQRRNEAATYITTQADATGRPHLAVSLIIDLVSSGM